VIGGVLTGCLHTSSRSILCSISADGTDHTCTLNSASGAGMVMGPLISGIIIHLGYFQRLFIGQGGILILMYPVCQTLLKQASREAQV
jgi:hypothetical protein